MLGKIRKFFSLVRMQFNLHQLEKRIAEQAFKLSLNQEGIKNQIKEKEAFIQREERWMYYTWLLGEEINRINPNVIPPNVEEIKGVEKLLGLKGGYRERAFKGYRGING